MTEKAIRLLRRKQVEDITGLSSEGIDYRVKAGIFPKPIKLGKRSVAWVEAEVITWINQKIAERSNTKN